jgi:hypothetical protein
VVDLKLLDMMAVVEHYQHLQFSFGYYCFDFLMALVDLEVEEAFLKKNKS